MTMHEKVSGTWKEITETHTKVSGTWKEIVEGWERVSGVWKQFYQSLTVLMDATRTVTSSDSSGTIDAAFYYDTDGGIRRSYETLGVYQGVNDYGEWVVDHPVTDAGDDFHIRVTHQTGTDRYSSGSGLGTWLALTSARSWAFSRAAAGSADASTYLVEISDDGGSTTLDSSTWTVNLNRET